MIKVGKELGLKSFEQVKDIHIEISPFSVENNLLTPTFKLKRVQVKEQYLPVLTELIDAVQKIEDEKERQTNVAEEKKAAESK